MKKILIWGTGKICRKLLNMLDRAQVTAFVETVPSRNVFEGRMVIAPDRISEYEYDLLLIAVAAAGEIERQIRDRKIDFDKVVFYSLSSVRKRGKAYENFKLLKTEIHPDAYNALLKEQEAYIQYDSDIFVKQHQVSEEKEILEMVEYVKERHYVQMLNYRFADEYLNKLYPVQAHDGEQLYDIQIEGKHLWLPGCFPVNSIIFRIAQRLAWMDGRSPLCFESPFAMTEPGILLEMNVQEGIFLLQNMERFETAFLIEPDMRWHKALRKTFKKHLGNNVFLFGSMAELRQSKIFSGFKEGLKERGYLKLDCGGNIDILKDILGFVEKENIKSFACASYYSDKVGEEIHKKLREPEWRLETSRGYVYYPVNQNLAVRRGVTFAERTR